MVDWFKTARAAGQAPRLFINDHGILPGGGGDTPHRAHYESTIQFLIDEQAPLDAIGMQGHFGSQPTAPDEVLAILDRFARFGKPIMVTEYDITVDDEELAGQFTRDLLTALFSHPAVVGFVMWGFWDGSTGWERPLYRRDWSLKPLAPRFASWCSRRGELTRPGRPAPTAPFRRAASWASTPRLCAPEASTRSRRRCSARQRRGEDGSRLTCWWRRRMVLIITTAGGRGRRASIGWCGRSGTAAGGGLASSCATVRRSMRAVGRSRRAATGKGKGGRTGARCRWAWNRRAARATNDS
jgi:hypothetical protein